MKLINPHGRVVSMPTYLYERLRKKKGYKEVIEQDSSTNYTVAELREMKPNMSDSDWESFIKGDTRKSISQL